MPDGTNIQQRHHLRINWYRVLESMMITVFSGVVVLAVAGAFTFLWKLSTGVEESNAELRAVTEVLTEEVSRLKTIQEAERLARVEKGLEDLANYVGRIPRVDKKGDKPLPLYRKRPTTNAPPDWRHERKNIQQMIEKKK